MATSVFFFLLFEKLKRQDCFSCVKCSGDWTILKTETSLDITILSIITREVRTEEGEVEEVSEVGVELSEPYQ